MPNSLLALRHKDGVAHQLYRYAAATPTLVGSTFGAAKNAISRVEGFKDRVIQFGGEIYVVGDDGIWKKDDPTVDAGTFTKQIDFVALSILNTKISGVYIFERSDDVYLACVAEASTPVNRWYAFTMPLSTGVWSNSAAGEIDGPTGTDYRLANVNDSVSFGGRIILTGHDTSTGGYWNSVAIDPFAKTIVIGRYTSGANIAFIVSMGWFNDKLLAVGHGSNYPYLTVREWAGTSFEHRLVTTINMGNNGAQTQLADVLWPDSGDFIYVFCPNNSGNGYWSCIEVNTTDWSYSDIGATVLPLALRPQAVTGHMAVRLVVDRITNPSTPDYLLYFCENPNLVGSVNNVYRWNGPASLMTLVDSGGAWHDAIAGGHYFGGERDFLPGSMSIVNTGTVPTLGGMIYKFRAYGGGASADKVFRLKRLDATGALVNSTLSAASGGSAVLDAPNKKVTGIQADGSIEYSVTFDFTTDGFAVGGKAKLAPEIALS